MNLLELLRQRRSIRKYTEENIPKEKLEDILKAGLLSPSGKGTRPWEFIVIKDRKTLDKMSGCRTGASNMLKGANAAILVLGDEDKTDTIIEDTSIALSNMHLMAHYLGIGSCWIQVRLRKDPSDRTTEEYLREILHFPANLRAEAILSLGMPGEDKEGYSDPDVGSGKVHYEKY